MRHLPTGWEDAAKWLSLPNLLANKNIHKIPVSELCQKAGINRSAFYNHYGSQFDVVKEMELDMIEDLDRIWEKEIQNSKWTLDKRAAAFCRYLKENESFVKLIFSNSDMDSEFAEVG